MLRAGQFLKSFFNLRMNQKKDKIAFIGTSQSFLSSIILEKLIEAANKHKDVEVACVIESLKFTKQQNLRNHFNRLECWLKKLFDPRERFYSYKVFTKIAKENGVPALNKIGGDINAPEFVKELKNRANIILSCSNYQILKSDFIESFDYCVNYHNSLLPKYRGVGATPLSVYNGERKTGFTFHKLSVGVDEGNILIQGEVSIDKNKSGAEHEWNKTIAAAQKIDKLLNMIKSREQGQLQQGSASYYSMKDFKQAYQINNLENWNFEQIEKIIKAFGGVLIKNKFVTKVKKSNKGISIKDGHIIIKRISNLPPIIYEGIKKFF